MPSTSFPPALDTNSTLPSTIVGNTDTLASAQGTTHSAMTDVGNSAIIAVETKIGINNSTDKTSLDYFRAAGWVSLPTLTYASATTATFPDSGGIIANLLNLGDKIWWIQSSTNYYNYIIGISNNGTTTTLTITSGYVSSVGDSSFQNSSISNGYYSKLSNPSGFSSWFFYTPSWTGFSANPTTGVARFKVDGREVSLYIYTSVVGTSNSTSLTVSLPITSANISRNLYYDAQGVDNGITLTTAALLYVPQNSTTATAYKDFSQAGWTNSGSKAINFTIFYDF